MSLAIAGQVRPDDLVAHLEHAGLGEGTVCAFGLTGDLAKDRSAVREVLPDVKHTGATGAFKFRRATDKSGKPAGYDADQLPIVSVTKGGRYVIEK